MLEERRLLRAELLALHEVECARLAAAVRGEPVHLLAAMDLRLGLLRRQVREVAPQLSVPVGQVHDMAESVIEGLRELLVDLEPPDTQLPLAFLLREAADQIFENCSVLVSD